MLSFLADSSTTIDLSQYLPFLNFGAVGLILSLVIAGKLRLDREVKARDNEIAELKATAKQYIEHYQRDVLPALIDSVKVSGEVLAYLNRHRD